MSDFLMFSLGWFLSLSLSFFLFHVFISLETPVKAGNGDGKNVQIGNLKLGNFWTFLETYISGVGGGREISSYFSSSEEKSGREFSLNTSPFP
jgi:hypothetical protein